MRASLFARECWWQRRYFGAAGRAVRKLWKGSSNRYGVAQLILAEALAVTRSDPEQVPAEDRPDLGHAVRAADWVLTVKSHAQSTTR